MQKPPDWRHHSQTEQSLTTLELEAPERRSGIMVWGGDLGIELKGRDLMAMWQRNSAGLENLRELQSSSGMEPVDTGIDGGLIHFQEYRGQVAGMASRTWVGHLSQGSRAYVLMGIFPDRDEIAAEQVRRVLSSVRQLAPALLPADLAPELALDDDAHADSLPTSDSSALDVEPMADADGTAPHLLDEWVDEPVDEAAIAAEDSDMPTASDELSVSAAEHNEVAPAFAKLALFLDSAGTQPLDRPLSRDIAQLIGLAEIEDLPPRTRVRAEWYYLDGDQGGEPFVVDEQLYQGDAEPLRFTLHRPDNTLFPQGSYRLLLLAGERVASADFFLRDPTEAELLVRARAGEVEGQFGLYAYLEMGQLQQVSEAAAVDWLTKAAHQGLAIAQYHLGLVYFDGLHQVPEDKVAAMDWFRRAALQDHADAAYFMARGYREGLGVPRNQGEAVAWTRRAASLGHAPSQYNLALHHLLGRGVNADAKLAVSWLRKALAAGYAPARSVLDWLESELDQTD